jgi:peptidoglycan/xylan/chitin deacetylase (PgdA/CDA1 family)
VSTILVRVRVASGRLRGIAHRTPPVFALNRRRLRRVADSGAQPAGVVRARTPANGELVVALSYDDGPSPVNTPALIELLARHRARATFFVVGEEVDRNPELARDIVAAGHELGNHSFSHPNLLALTGSALKEDFEHAAESVERAVGRRPTLVRPPYGKRAGDVAELCGSTTVLWSVDSGDTAGFAADRVAHEVIAHVRSGDVVLMHDGGDERPATLGATARILEALAGQGYRFVTVSELLAGS